MEADNNLFNQLIESTGLPKEEITRELEGLLSRAGVNSTDFSIEELREALANYLQDVLLQTKEQILDSND